jgi:hypothetical protein
MLRRTLAATFLIISLVIVPFPSTADEGMWLPDSLDKLPLTKLKSRGLQLEPEAIYSATKPSLKDAIVVVGGGTGSFVSPEGLILTNHHVAFTAVTAASTPQNDYITHGFLAKSRAEEIPAKDYTVMITQDFKDVTSEVLAAVKPGMSDAERNQAIAAKTEEIAKAAGQGREKDGIRTQVTEMLSGMSYYLYTYLMLRDVRMVYVPPKSIGYFGGDPDNFEWPRHCGDFSFLRAYVGPDGKSAAYSKDNVPFKPKKFLALDASGYKEGDFAMVMGYPGTTYRYRESYSVEYHQNLRLPYFVETLQEQIDYLTAVSERDPALKIKFADQIFSLSNTVKNFEGTLQGLRRSGLVAKKRAEEADFSRAVAADPALKAKYGEVLPQIAELYRELTSFSLRQNTLNDALHSSDLMGVLALAYRRARDREKPPEQRAPQLREENLKQLTASLPAAWQERVPAVEAQLLALALKRSSRLEGEQRSPTLEKLLTGQTDEERQQSAAELARRAVEETKFKAVEEVIKLFSLSATELRAIDDPALKFVIAATDELSPLDERTERFNSAITKLRPLFLRGLLEWKKTTVYPDANRTLRFTYGEIKGYSPRDAVNYDYLTSLAGVLEKDTGAEPFDVPAKLKELQAKQDFGPYVEPRIKDVPVNFLATTDITGGNSGSPLLNGRGEIIGLVFDGNYEGLGSDYVYNPALSRTIAVDIRYVLFVTDKFAGAGYLFDEMQIRRGKAAAAKKAA